MAATVERAALAPDLTISRVVTGLWQVADMEREGPLDVASAADAMAPYVRAGLTTFDMADHYGSAEDIAGCFHERAPGGEGAELLTKWVPRPGPLGQGDVRRAVETSLARLRSERIDLLQLHAWSYADPSWLDALFWLQELREEGVIRHLGVTNFDAAHLLVALRSGIRVVSDQVCLSLLDARPLGRLAPLCVSEGVALLAYGTLAGGFLGERWLGAPEPPRDALATWSEMKYMRFIEAAGGWRAFQALLATVERVARRHGVSVANVASRWALEQPGVAGVIVGARLGRSEHVADNLRVFAFSLDEEDRSELDEARALLSPIPGEPGDEYRRPPFLTASGDLSHHLDALPPPYETRLGTDGRTRALSGTRWEEVAGFSRAVRAGDRVWVSGTTATHRDRPVGGDDPAAQLHFAVDKVEGALRSLGSRLEDVVRTRVFVRDVRDWEAVARAHGERFGAVGPANTLVQAGLVGDEYRVEVEAEAVVGSEGADPGGLPPDPPQPPR